MNSDLVKQDTNLIYDFDKTVSDIDTVFEEISGNLESVQNAINSIAEEMRIRAYFHMRWGVEKVKVHLC